MSPLARHVSLAMLGSFGLLAAALAFQILGGLAPCPLCVWQRWPHGIAFGLGALVLATAWRGGAALGALILVAGAGLAGFHAGVEQGWWDGPSTCTSGGVGGMTADELMARIMEAPLVRCDEIAWRFAGLSMAAWNAIGSLALGLVWARGYASSSASQ